jgi:hypothetical protein
LVFEDTTTNHALVDSTACPACGLQLDRADGFVNLDECVLRLDEADLVTDVFGLSRLQHGLDEAGEPRVQVVAS